MKEYILCAAIHFDDGNTYTNQPANISTGFVICGRRHHNCYATYAAIREVNDKKHFQLGESVQGFITNRDRFLNRKEAYIIALSCEQITKRPDNEELDRIFGKIQDHEQILISEDLY